MKGAQSIEVLAAVAVIAVFIIVIQIANFGKIAELTSRLQGEEIHRSLAKLKFACELSYFRGNGEPIEVGLRKNYSINITTYGIALSDRYKSRETSVLSKMIAKNLTGAIIRIDVVEIGGERYLNLSAVG